MHIALARALLPSLLVMHCVARPRIGHRKQSGYMAVAFDEMNGPGGDLRPAYEELSRWLKETPPDALEYRRQEAEFLIGGTKVATRPVHFVERNCHIPRLFLPDCLPWLRNTVHDKKGG